MSDTTHSAHPKPPLATDTELEQFLGGLLPPASERRFWMLYLERDHRLSDLLLPMDEQPAEPDDVCDAKDLGRVSFAQLIVDRAGSICGMIGGASAIFVWERPGSAAASPRDRRWVHAIEQEAARQGVSLRAQFLLHDAGLRVISGGDGRARADQAPAPR